MGKKENRIIAIALLVSVALLVINIPFIDGKNLSMLITFIVAIYMLIK